MTGTTGPAARAGAVFDYVADFLDKCNFKVAADAVRTQFNDKGVPQQTDFLRNLREYVDRSVLLLSELDMISLGATADKATTEGDVDGVLRKLLAAGHVVSDEALNVSIDNILRNDMFAKMNMIDDSQRKQSTNDDVLGISEADVQKYWKEIQKESAKEPQPPSEVAEGTAAAPAGTTTNVPAQDAQAPVLPAPVPTSPSEHYVPRSSRSSPALEEDMPEADEYADDDDLGYTIRSIYEAELLRELAEKMQTGHVPGARPVKTETARATPPEDIVDELTVSSPSPAHGPTDTSVAKDSQEATPEIAVGDTVQGTSAMSTLKDKASDADRQQTSPTFGGSTAAPTSTSTSTVAPTAAASPTAQHDSTEQKDKDKDTRVERKRQVHSQRRHVKYAASGDPFYPVELDGVIYDSFGLRVVFERDKTGFEESKEFPIRMNSVVAARYQILEYLGSAAFSRAVQCLDLVSNKMVCMKIIKNDKDFFDQSLDEIKLLKYINVNGDPDSNCILQLYDYFYHKEHLIIVTELLRDNLYEFSKFNRDCGDEPYFTLGRLQKITKQVLSALEYVHSLRLIHCDLKPENILIKSYSRCEVKVIDFGSSCFVDDHLSSYVQSRSYRAPEVMLGLQYDQKIDLWSLGCIIAELWTGYVLFQNDSVQSLLARILGIIGEFPFHIMTRGRYVPQYFTQDGQLYQEIDGPACPDRGRRLNLLVPKKTSLKQRMHSDSAEFVDFLTQVLQLDPTKRPTATEALQHPWLTRCKYSDGL